MQRQRCNSRAPSFADRDSKILYLIKPHSFVSSTHSLVSLARLDHTNTRVTPLRERLVTAAATHERA